MNQILLSEGAGRTRVSLSTNAIGSDLIVYLFNDSAHLGAVAVAEYSREEDRTSTSVITRLGHKDDMIARNTAHKLSKMLKSPVCAIAGIHVDGITETEIGEILRNCEKLAEKLAAVVSSQ